MWLTLWEYKYPQNWLVNKNQPKLFCKKKAIHYIKEPDFQLWDIGSVLGHSCCCNKNSIAWTFLNNKHLFLNSAGWEVQDQGTDSVSGEGPLLVQQQPSFYCPNMAQRVRELSSVSFIRALIPLLRAPTSWPSHLPKTPPLNTLTVT